MNTHATLALLVTIGLAAPAWAQEIDCESSKTVRQSTIVFTSTRHNPTAPFIEAAEIYLMDLDMDVSGNPVLGSPRRLTEDTDRDTVPALSPDGTGRIVFDSNRVRKHADPPEPTSVDLFLIKEGDSLPTFLTRGSSASWSPDSKRVVFHRSASDTFVPPVGNPSPGAPTDDSDIFVIKVSRGAHRPKNLTFEDPRVHINEDADWSPDGKRIAFARRDADDNGFPASSGDIWVMNANGTHKTQLTFHDSSFEDKSPAWSPDGKLIAYSCRYGPALTDRPEICVIKADGTDAIPKRLTFTAEGELGPHWIPSDDGEMDKILYQRPLVQMGGQQIWMMDADGTHQTQLTFANQGTNQGPNWGVIRAKCGDDGDGDDDDGDDDPENLEPERKQGGGR